MSEPTREELVERVQCAFPSVSLDPSALAYRGRALEALTTLSTRLRLAEEDRERVDWLERQQGPDDYTPPHHDSKDGMWFMYHNDDEKDVDAPTLREAIDAARAATKPEEAS